jgi:hypothetical protein
MHPVRGQAGQAGHSSMVYDGRAAHSHPWKASPFAAGLPPAYPRPKRGAAQPNRLKVRTNGGRADYWKANQHGYGAGYG